MCQRTERRLECRLESVPLGRHFAAATLSSWGVAGTDPAVGVLDDVLLVTTELMANAVVVCSEPITLTLEAHRDRIEIDVRDDSPAPAVPQSPSPSAPAGRGLAIVEALTSQWGQENLDGTHKRVWGHVALPEGSALARGCRL